MTYQPRIYKKQGGSEMVFGPGSTITLGTTALSASGAELNLLAGQVAGVTFTPAAGAANVCEVTMTFTDAAAATLAHCHEFTYYLSDSATGAELTATTTSGAVTVKTSSGTILQIYVAKMSSHALSLANGTFILSITDTAKTGFYVVVVLPSGRLDVSAQLITANYG